MKIEVFFGSIPFLSKDYQNVIDFVSIQNQKDYFKSRLTLRSITNIHRDGEVTSIIVDVPTPDFSRMDYLTFNDGKKDYYYFIDSIVEVTANRTEFIVTLDAFQTYLFDYTLLDSFVERCHVPRWNGDIPTKNTIDEGLALGEYIQQSVENLYEYNNGMIIATTSPLGAIDGYVPPSSGGGGGGGATGDWSNGIMSGNGFRFIKGFEGFAPRKYQDSEGYWTICYGVTRHGEQDIFDYLVSKEPVPEEEGAKVSYKLKNDRYGKVIIKELKEIGITEQRQFDALTSLCYNVGNGVITTDKWELKKVIKQDPKNESAIRPVWERTAVTGAGSGEVLPGLVARRKDECSMYFGKPYNNRSIGTINSSGNIDGTVTENNGNGWLPT